jgi:hypothetical protein
MKLLLSTLGLLGVAGISLLPIGTNKKDELVKKSDSKPVFTLPAKVTYAEHVAPILNSRCAPCHHPGAVGPFSLVGFENAKKHSATVANAAGERRMPPWKAVHGYGEFKDENRLSDEQIALIKKWTETGTSRGDQKLEPKAPTFSGEWQAGTPDIVLSPSKPFKLDEEGDDVYRNFVFDLGNTEPVYVRGMDVKPSNRKVVHHVIAFLDSSGRSAKFAEKSKDGQEGYTSSGGGIGTTPSGSLGGWAPGVTVAFADKGTAFKIAPGTKIVMQVHYHKSGKEEVDQTKLGLYVSKQAPEKQLEIFWAANPIFRIPPGADNHKVAWSERIPIDSTLYSVMPHMHLLGKSMKAKITLPDGKEIPLVFVDKWDFNWQIVYQLKEPLFVPRGSRLSVEAFYDNSTKNPHNPREVPEAVGWGEQTTDEMALLVAVYASGKPMTMQEQMREKIQDRIQQFLKGGGGK